MKRNVPPQDQSSPITIECVERDIEFMAYVVKKYGDVYAPILTRLRVDLDEMRRAQASMVKSTSKPHLSLGRSEITDDTPLRLETAARFAFPDGAVSANALRSAASRGDLEHERLAGRVVVTLRWIREWRERNRRPAQLQVEPGRPAISDERRAAALASATQIVKGMLKPTKPKG